MTFARADDEICEGGTSMLAGSKEPSPLQEPHWQGTVPALADGGSLVAMDGSNDAIHAIQKPFCVQAPNCDLSL